MTATHRTLEELIAARAEFDLLFVDPRRYLTTLNEDYVDGPGTLDRCLPIYQVMTEKAVAVVLTRICHLGVVATELLPRCGFTSFAEMLPLDEADGYDIRRARIIAIACRGKAKLSLPAEDELRAMALADPLQAALAVYPSAERKLHVFAAAETPGWTSLIGNATWTEVPTLHD